MLDDKTFETVRTILVNWHAFGSPRAMNLPGHFADEMANIADALKGSTGAAADIEARVQAHVPAEMAAALDSMLEDGPSERELGLIREKCPPELAAQLLEIAGADTGALPPLNRPWGRHDLLPWLLVLPTGPADEPGPELKPLLEIKDWWKRMEYAL